MMKPILTDLYQKWMSDGELFTMMGIRHVTPWAEETDGKVLALEYFGNRSGSKIIAPLLEKMLTEAGLSYEAKQNIVDLIWIRFGRNWGKLWDTLTVVYNPIENYRMTETGKINHGGDQQNGVYGFNSTAAVPSGTGHDEYIDNTELTRSGNIGVTTSQQMIQSERDLWVWKFFEQVFQDVDTVLSIDVYGQTCLGDFSEYHGTSYVLPPATAETLGGIKVGANLTVEPDGTLSADVSPEPVYPVTSVNGKTGAVVLTNDDVGSPSLAEFQQNTQDIAQIMVDVPFRFGIDVDGNYGYYKEGADTVTPFNTGGGKGPFVYEYRFTTESDYYKHVLPIEIPAGTILGFDLRIDNISTRDNYSVVGMSKYDNTSFMLGVTSSSSGNDVNGNPINYDPFMDGSPSRGYITNNHCVYIFNNEFRYITNSGSTDGFGLGKGKAYTLRILIE